MNDKDQLEHLAWWACNSGIFLAGFALACIFILPWLGISAALFGIAFFWIGWEIEHAVNERDLDGGDE